MKILVFGAGVLGCNIADSMFRAGKDVKLLAAKMGGEKCNVCAICGFCLPQPFTARGRNT